MKCGWSPCRREAIVDDGFCGSSHMRLWMIEFNSAAHLRITPDQRSGYRWLPTTTRT
jgi:hypothetical protein